MAKKPKKVIGNTCLMISAPNGFYYQGYQMVKMTIGYADVSKAVADLWNAWWVEQDKENTDCILHHSGDSVFVMSAESYTLADFAATLEQVISIPVRIWGCK